MLLVMTLVISVVGIETGVIAAACREPTGKIDIFGQRGGTLACRHCAPDSTVEDDPDTPDIDEANSWGSQDPRVDFIPYQCGDDVSGWADPPQTVPCSYYACDCEYLIEPQDVFYHDCNGEESEVWNCEVVDEVLASWTEVECSFFVLNSTPFGLNCEVGTDVVATVALPGPFYRRVACNQE